MTNQEFSDEFDVLFNNIMSNLAPGINEYEKSVFLTKALDEIIKSYFNPVLNKTLLGFDGNEKRLIDFSMLIRTIIGENVSSNINIHGANNISYYKMPIDILLYINEFLTVKRGSSVVNLTVIPVSYTEYSRLMSKPFKRPLKNLAWRLITSGAALPFKYTDYLNIALTLINSTNLDSSVTLLTLYDRIVNKNISIYDNYGLKVDNLYLNNKGQLITDYTECVHLNSDTISDITKLIDKEYSATHNVLELIPGPTDIVQQYIVRYVARPKPIILTNLDNENVSIGGLTKESSCELDPIIHLEILQRAVELAKIAYNTQEANAYIGTVATGASGTEKGILTRQS